MKSKIARYHILSIIFLIISIVLIMASFILRQWSSYQYEIIFLAVGVYLVSSLAHHYFDKSLTFEIGVEYILIGALAFLVVFGFAY